MTQVTMATNTTPHRLPPLIYPNSTVSPSRDFTGHAERGVPEGQGTKDRQEKAARRRELARRHLSNSLQGMRTILPDLRRTESFSVPVSNSVRDQSKTSALGRRDTKSLGARKPQYDLQDVRAGVRRSHSLRETGSRLESPVQPLSQSLPQTAHLSLAALVHELNASMHHQPSHVRCHGPNSSVGEESDDSTIDHLFDYQNGLDPDLCPRLTGHDPSGDPPVRTLTPALRKLNRRRVSSRVRTQQWVNQIEREQRLDERKNKEGEAGTKEMVVAKLDLLFEQGDT